MLACSAHADSNMNIEVKINNVSKPVVLGSLSIEDNRNERIDTCRFELLSYGSNTYRPEVSDDVVVLRDGVKEFAGKVISVDERLDGHSVLRFLVECKDHQHEMDRRKVLERFNNKLASEIIKEIFTKYAPGFNATTYVSAPTMIKAITFNRLTLSECLEKLSDLTNYSWYVDYDKRLHFFARDAEPAPFNITDTSENYIFDTLELSSDMSQLRNRVTVIGGEQEGNHRIEEFEGERARVLEDGAVAFDLISRFGSEPTVKVNGVEKLVGVEYLSREEDFDCFWSYQEKYVRFKSDTKPEASDTVTVEGIPLYPIIVSVSDSNSILQYGVYEHVKIENTVRSREQAIDLGLAELSAYAAKLSEGSFKTYTPGLRSGQIININSDLRGINEDFVIQRVRFSMLGNDLGEWTVELATLKKVGIINILQRLLAQEVKGDTSQEGLLSLKQFSDGVSVGDSVTMLPKTSAPYLIEQDNPESDSYDPPFRINFSTVAP